jgi:uncharacterized protein (UPF0333 family)
MRNKKGQSILEYVIVLTVIVAAIAIAATQYIKPGVEKSFENVNSSIVNASGRLPGVPHN